MSEGGQEDQGYCYQDKCVASVVTETLGTGCPVQQTVKCAFECVLHLVQQVVRLGLDQGLHGIT